MGEKDIHSIALFFFFVFLDEARAREASMLAVTLAREEKKRHPKMESGQIVVYITERLWRRRKDLEGEGSSVVGREWVLPANVNLHSWGEFLKIASPEELSTVIWSAILGYSDDCIAQALNLTPGTVRYRWGHGLEKLGRCFAPKIAAVPV